MEQFIFCRRSRKVQYEKSPYEIVPNTLSSHSNYITADVINKENGHLFVLKLEGVKVRKHLQVFTNYYKIICFSIGQYIPF